MIIIPPQQQEDTTKFAKELVKGVFLGIGITVGVEITREAVRRRWVSFREVNEDKTTNN